MSAAASATGPRRRLGGLVGGLAFLLAAGTVIAAAYPAALRIPRADPQRAASPPPLALFSHRSHEIFACYACHPSIFAQAAVGFTHADMDAGRFCARCHEGRRAFAVKATACERCHAPGR